MNTLENKIYKNVDHCRVCKSTDFIEVFKMDSIPLAGSFCKTYSDALNSPLVPFTLVINKYNGLLQCLEDVDSKSIYENYQYRSSEIPSLINHFQGLALMLKDRYSDNKDVSLLEVGANDFPLLNQLPSDWWLCAVDPSDVSREAKRSKNISLYNAYFSKQFIIENGFIETFDIVTGSNCFAHCKDIETMLKGAYLALKYGGEFWMEVKCGEILIDSGIWDDYYSEHPVLWTVPSLRKVMGDIGFEYIEHEILPFHGGLIRIGFRKGIKHFFYPLPKNYIENIKLKYSKTQTSYNNRYDSDVSKELLNRNDNLAFGASGKASVLLSSLNKISFDYIVDDAPSKQGKFLPHTGIPIVSSEHLKCETNNKNCLVTAWNYFDDIKSKYNNCNVNWMRYFK